MSEDIEVRRRRAAWRAIHRGTKELDFLVGRFADDKLPAMIDPELDRFERLLAASDPELQSWLLGPASQPEDAELAGLISEMRTFHGLG
jgi:antitoxin CptB